MRGENGEEKKSWKWKVRNNDYIVFINNKNQIQIYLDKNKNILIFNKTKFFKYIQLKVYKFIIYLKLN